MKRITRRRFLKVSGATSAALVAGSTFGIASAKQTRRGSEKDVDDIISRMTLDEKVQLTHTISNTEHAREVPAIPRLGIPALLMTNGPSGVSAGGPVQKPATALPAPIALAATWDQTMGERYGSIGGSETRSHGRNLLEGPDVNIARVPLNGRTFEAYGEDPYLAGQIAVGNITGIQEQGVIANVKHYDANNQETDRSSISADVDKRTLREIYFPAFETAVKQARVGSVMGAKNKVNGTYSCQNPYLLSDILKDEWGFDGFVITDFSSAHDTVAAANAGLDIELPEAKYFGQALKEAVQSGKVSTATLDDKVRRILRIMMRFGLFDRQPKNSPIDAKAHGAVARSIAEAGTVLLKNDADLLPLDSGGAQSIAVIGSGSARAVTGGRGSSNVDPLYTVSPLQGIRERVGSGTKVTHAQGAPPQELGPSAVPAHVLAPPDSSDASSGASGLRGEYFDNPDFRGKPSLTRVDPYIVFHYSGGGPDVPEIDTADFSIRWSGTFTPPTSGSYELSLTIYGDARLYLNDELLIDNGGGFPANTKTATVTLTGGTAYPIRIEYENQPRGIVSFGWQPPEGTPDPLIAEASEVAAASDVAIVFAGDVETEAIDRDDLALPGTQNDLIEAVAKANKNTIVVLNTGAPVLMPWVERVSAIAEAWYPGEEDGNAIAAVLFGDSNPSGKLPITFGRRLEDYPANTRPQYPGVDGVSHYSEGLYVGYRHFDQESIEPLFEFGYGLSYTNFAYGNLKIVPKGHRAHADRKVSLKVTNTGERAGAEVVQLYLGFPDNAGEPPRQLKGFRKVHLEPGESRHVRFRIQDRDLSYWDVARDDWLVPAGRFQAMVGSSSRDIRLQGSFAVAGRS